MSKPAMIAAVAGLALAAILQSSVGGVAAPKQDEVTVYKKALEQRFGEWLQSLWPQAEQAGVSRETFDANIKGLKLNWTLPHLVLPNPAAPDGPALPAALAQASIPKHQPEFDAPAGYFKAGALRALAATGRTKFQEYGPALAAIQKQYGVPASIVVAI